MARASSSAQDAALEALHRDTRLYVEVYDGFTWLDLTALGGEQWIRSVQLGEDEDRRVSRATLSIHRETHERSLAPLVDAAPLLVAGALIRVGVQVTLADGASTGRTEMIEGRIDEAEWGGDAPMISIEVRDVIMGSLHDTWLTEDLVVGPGFMPVLVQEILTAGGSAVTLVTLGDAEAFSFPAAGTIQPQSLDSGIQSLVDQSGWDIRRREHEGQFKLVLSEPADPSASTPTPVATLTPQRYYSVSAMGLSGIGVRDEVIVRWESASGGEFGTVTVRAAAQVFGGGWRTILIDERDNDLVTTEAQAVTFGEKVLLVTARVPVAMQVEMPFDWRWELGDWLRFAPNDVHHSANWEGAVTGIAHRIEPGVSGDGGGTTTLTIRGSYGGGLGRIITSLERTRIRRQMDDWSNPEPAALPQGAGWYYTTVAGFAGFSVESTRDSSLGGFASTSPVSGGVNAVFRPVTESEATNGVTRYAVLALVNSHATLTWEAVRAWLPDAGASADVAFAIGLDPNGVMPLLEGVRHGTTIADHTTAPSGVVFSSPGDVATGLEIADMAPMTAHVVHVRLTITAGATDLETGGNVCAATNPPSEP